MSIPNRLKSRKFWMTLLGFGIMGITNLLKLPTDLVHMIYKGVEILVPTYVGTQGLVDGTLSVMSALGDNKPATKRKNAKS